MDFKDIINYGLNKIRPYIPGTPIIEIARKYGIKRPVKMNSNENALGVSKKAFSMGKKILKRTNIYPDPESRRLKEVIAGIHGVKPENVVVGNGGDEIFYYLTMAFVNNDDEAVIPEITFPIYETAVDIMRGRVVKSRMKNYQIDVDDILKKITGKTKLIFFCNPNNPTGYAIGEREFLKLVKGVPENVLLIVDEAYGDFNDLPDFPDTVKIWKKGYKNIVLVKTLSKSHGFAGLRVGYMVGDTSITELINRIRLPFNITLVSQEAAVGALKDRGFYEKTLNTIREGKRLLYDFFNELGINYFESHTNYILFDVKMDAGRAAEEFMKRGILVRSAASYGFPTYLRVTIGTRRQNAKFMKALKEIYKGE